MQNVLLGALQVIIVKKELKGKAHLKLRLYRRLWL